MKNKKKVNYLPILITIAVVLACIVVGISVNEYISRKNATQEYSSIDYSPKNDVQNQAEILSLNNAVESVESNTAIDSNDSATSNNEVVENKTEVTEKNKVENNTVSEGKKVDESMKNTTTSVQESKSRKIDPSKPMVALTFDDGPNNIATPKILDTLEKYGVVATFFDLGTCMKSYPKVVKREETLGCEVASHTYSHQNLNTLSAKQIQKDVNKAITIYENTLGHKPALVRPPYGNANATVRKTINYPLINWDIDTLDWKSRKAKSVLKEIHKYSNYDGRIILMHGIYTSTAEAVEKLVPELIEKGYQLVTVSEMAKYKGVTLKSGKVYLNFRK